MLATTTATSWGITGAQFLWGYGALCAIAAMVVWQERRRVLGPVPTTRDPQPELGPYRLALISGGPQRAITAAAAQLFRDGCLAGADGTLTASGELARTADPLEREVFEAVRHEPGIPVEDMNARVRDGDAIAAMTEQMTRSGLLADAADVRRLRLLWIVPALLAALGLARVLGGADDGVVLFALIATAVVATLWLLSVRPLATRRGRSLLQRQRRASAPNRLHPAAGEIGLVTALYGGGSLWIIDPVTASALRVPREEERGGAGASSSGGCGAGGWDGGGDSGGGGGGCGGGGCGGGN